MVFADDLDDMEKSERAASRALRKEMLDLAELREVAEGDITISETTGFDALPELDDEETEDDVLGEDDLTIHDENDGDLGLTYEAGDAYLDDEVDIPDVQGDDTSNDR